MSLSEQLCVPCAGGVAPASEADIADALSQLPDWKRSEDGKAIETDKTFKNYAQALVWVNAISAIAEEEGHHPDISFGWGYVRVRLMTHAIDALHSNDFIVAAKMDAIEA